MKHGFRMRTAVQMIGCLLPLAVWVAITPAAAQTDTPEARQACTPEVFRVCNDAVPDRDKIVACLQRNRAYLAPACRRFISAPASHVHKRPRHVRRV